MRTLVLGLAGASIATIGMAALWPLVWGAYRAAISPGERLDYLLEGGAWFLLIVGGAVMLVGRFM